MTAFGTKELAGYEQGVQAERERIIQLIWEEIEPLTSEILTALIEGKAK